MKGEKTIILLLLYQMRYNQTHHRLQDRIFQIYFQAALKSAQSDFLLSEFRRGTVVKCTLKSFKHAFIPRPIAI